MTFRKTKSCKSIAFSGGGFGVAVFMVLTLLLLSATGGGTQQVYGLYAEENTKNENSHQDVLDLFETLLKDSGGIGSAEEKREAFINLYGIYSHNPHLPNGNTLPLLFQNADQYNVLIDFIGQLPLKKPETIENLLKRAGDTRWLKPEDQRLFISIFQALLELLGHGARYAPHLYDYDALLKDLTDTPFNRAVYYDRVFTLQTEHLNIEKGKKDPIDYLLEGIDNRVMMVNGTNYRYSLKTKYREILSIILEKQEACSWETLTTINQLLTELSAAAAKGETPGPGFMVRLREEFNRLPRDTISKKAPRNLLKRVSPYPQRKLKKDLKRLEKMLNRKASGAKTDALVKRLKEHYLIHHLNHYLLTLAYAINGKDHRLRAFINPNLVRLHDFDPHPERWPWNYSGLPGGTDSMWGYRLSGGLSRLERVFASKRVIQMTRRRVYNRISMLRLVTGILKNYPITQRSNMEIQTNALLVKLGRQLTANAGKNETTANQLKKYIPHATAGFHYRRAMDFLDGKKEEHGLFAVELKRLALQYYRDLEEMETDIPEAAVQLNELLKQKGTGTGDPTSGLWDLSTHYLPEEAAVWFEPGLLTPGGMDAFFPAAAAVTQQENLPAYLVDMVLFRYIVGSDGALLSGNHPKDYYSALKTFEMFSPEHIEEIIKKLNRQGWLTLMD